MYPAFPGLAGRPLLDYGYLLDDLSDDDELLLVAGQDDDADGQDDDADGQNEDADGQNGHAGGQDAQAQDQVPVAPPNPVEDEAPDYNHDRIINLRPNTEMRENFRKYCQLRQSSHNNNFSNPERRAVKLMGVLKGTRAALNTYDAILEWHHREKGDITERESLKHVSNVDKYLSRQKMLKILETRYYLEGKGAKNSTIRLPNSKADVTLTFHNAWDCIESLLIDPRVKDSDYAFHQNDPFAPPPPVSTNGTISELHTARAYYEAYQKFIKFPGKQVLLPIVMYIDGAVTGQFSSMPITALKMSLGIHNRKHREKECAWRTLGYVASVSTPNSQGSQLFYESGHMEAEFERLVKDKGTKGLDSACKAQDFHTMLDALLTSYVDVQTNGFVWDLRYRGKTYKDIEFVPFVIFVKCDTLEADLLCGSYTNRNKGVAQLCRYCTCPTNDSDKVHARYPPKTVEMVQKLIEAKNLDGLKKLSQQMITNAWYKIRFQPYNHQGIHGSCPSEMLHALLLGVFKYTRLCFFDEIGATSQLADRINALAQVYGNQFARQAERDKPNCSFKQGIIKSGRVMAKEYRGILLVIAAVLRSQRGQVLLSANANFTPEKYKDWVLLIETLLEWEAFLTESEMNVRHILRLRKKHRFIMYLVKKVCNRSKGMGMKLMKFHAIIHMWLDIYLYGVPNEHDTGSNESQHKLTKIAAKLTQKNETTFDFQTCTRLDEFLMIELALAELNDDLKPWDYFTREAEIQAPDPPVPLPRTGGAKIHVFKDPKFGLDPVFSLGDGKKSREALDIPWSKDLLQFLFDLQQKLNVSNLEVRGEHRREGTLFRGHPNYREKPWRDWATIDWGDEELPGQMWCFVVIDFDPDVRDDDGNLKNIEHGGIEVKRGTYAVLESATYDERDTEKAKSDLFIPIKKEVGRKGNRNVPWKRKFYLADVEAIVCPLVVVPNVGGTHGYEYLLMRNRSEWTEIFKKWLDDPHENDEIPDTEPVPLHNVLHY